MVGTLRVFAAIAPPAEVRQALAEQLRPHGVPGKRVPPSNYHITLRFLGAIDEVTFDRYRAELDQMDLGASFVVSLQVFGAFPNERKASVVWAGVDRGAQRVYQLAELADEAAARAGVLPEDRPFLAHLTLSRVRPPAEVSELVAASELDVSWRVNEVVLFETRPGRGNVIYEPLDFFPLRR